MYRSRALMFLLAMLFVAGVAVEANAETYTWTGNAWHHSFRLRTLWEDSLGQSPANDSSLDGLMSNTSLGAEFQVTADIGIRGRNTQDGRLPNNDVAITINAPFYFAVPIGDGNYPRGMSFKDQFKDWPAGEVGEVSTYTFAELYFQGTLDCSDADRGTTHLAGNMQVTGPAEFVSNSNSASNPVVLDIFIDASRVDEMGLLWYQQGSQEGGARTNDSELHLNNSDNAFFGTWVVTTTASALVDGCLGDADVEVRGAAAFSTDPNITWNNGVNQGILELRSSGAISPTAKLELTAATSGTLSGKVVVDTGVAANVRQLVIDGTCVPAGTYGSANYPGRIDGTGTITVADVNATAIMTMECKDHLGATITGDAGLMPRVGTKGYKPGYAARIRAQSSMAISGVGYTFLKWQVGGVDHSTSPDTTVTMNADKTVTAVYTKASGASQPAPANRAGAISIMNGISWTPDPAATTQSVYFGTSTAVYGVGATPLPGSPFGGSLSSLTNDQLGGAMKENTNYYWQVRSNVGSDAKPQWMFTTGNIKATTPSPANNAIGQATSVTLQWSSPDAGATSFDVYFGTDKNAVENGLVTPTNVGVTQLGKTGLLRGVWYYWRVDCEFPGRTAVGDVWGFRVDAYKLNLNTDTPAATDELGNPLAGVTASVDDAGVAIFRFTSFSYSQQYDVNAVGSRRLAIWSDGGIDFGGFLNVSAPMNNSLNAGPAVAGGYLGGPGVFVMKHTSHLVTAYSWYPPDLSKTTNVPWTLGDMNFWRRREGANASIGYPIGDDTLYGPGRPYAQAMYGRWINGTWSGSPSLKTDRFQGIGGAYGGDAGMWVGDNNLNVIRGNAGAYASLPALNLPGVYGQKEVYELWGGSGGLGGGLHTSTTTDTVPHNRVRGGSGGGGAVEMFAVSGNINIGVNARIIANGGSTMCDNVNYGGMWPGAVVPTGNANTPIPGGAGSGGSVRLVAAGNVTITGNISADGGKGADAPAIKPASGGCISSGGGGGRVAVYKSGTLTNTGVVSASGGVGGRLLNMSTDAQALSDGRNGTVYGLQPGEGTASMVTSAHWPIPADGTGGVPVGTANLTWLPGLGSTTNELYFGTTTSPSSVTTITDSKYLRARQSYAVSVVFGTKYYWQVKCDGVMGPLWTFRTTGYEAKNPTPASGSVNVSPTGLQLSWQDGYDPANITKREVFFGTDQTAVANAGTSSPLKIATLGAGPSVPLVVNLSTLLASTTYYWKVDTFWSIAPTYVDGLVWNFTTRPASCTGVLSGDFNNDCKVTFIDFALLAANWKLCNLPDPLDCE